MSYCKRTELLWGSHRDAKVKSRNPKPTLDMGLGLRGSEVQGLRFGV